MSLMKWLRGSSAEPRVAIQRSLGGIVLGTPISSIEHSSEWCEMTDTAAFFAGISGERLFMIQEGQPRMCGFVRGELYKVALAASPSDGKAYIDEFTAKYGRPQKPRRMTRLWEDKQTCVEVHMRRPLNNIMLTDTALLRRAYAAERGEDHPV